MRRSLPILLTLLLVAIVGCSEKKEKIVYEELHFPIDKEVELEMVIEDPLWPALIKGFEVYNGKLVLLCSMNEKLIHFYDAESGDELKHTVRRGRGPGEMLGSFVMDLNRESGLLSLFDYTLRELYQVNVDSLFHERAIIASTGDDFGVVNHVYTLPQGYLTFGIPLVSQPERRYTLLNDNGEEITYTEYPYDNINLIRSVFTNHKISFSKERTRMVAIGRPGLILEVFDLTDGIKKRARRYYNKLFITEDRRSLDSEKSGYGVIDLSTSDNYIYTIYGEPNSNKSFNNIAIFDWEGNAIKILRTKYKKLYNISVDSEERFLYLIGEKEDGNYFTAKLDLSILENL